jgi:alkylhydroperoxidase/carboxymuconolactone decarboxylase family protein YurZ
MADNTNRISNAFMLFMKEAPETAQVWGSAIQGLAAASALDAKTRELAYVAVLAALNRTSGIAYHVASLKALGATREEVISAVLVGLPAAGHVVTQSLPAAIDAYDAE